MSRCMGIPRAEKVLVQNIKTLFLMVDNTASCTSPQPLLQLCCLVAYQSCVKFCRRASHHILQLFCCVVVVGRVGMEECYSPPPDRTKGKKKEKIKKEMEKSGRFFHLWAGLTPRGYAWLLQTCQLFHILWDCLAF